MTTLSTSLLSAQPTAQQEKRKAVDLLQPSAKRLKLDPEVKNDLIRVIDENLKIAQAKVEDWNIAQAQLQIIKISAGIYTAFNIRTYNLTSLIYLPQLEKKDEQVLVHFEVTGRRKLRASFSEQDLPSHLKVVIQVLKKLFENSLIDLKTEIGASCTFDKDIFEGRAHVDQPFTFQEKVVVARTNGSFQIGEVNEHKEKIMVKIDSNSFKTLHVDNFKKTIPRRYLVELDATKLAAISQEEIEAELNNVKIR